MEYSLEITDFAESSIEEIVTWYAGRDSVARAEKVRDSIYEMIDKVSQAPFAFKSYENTNTPRAPLRYAVVKNIHAIVFEIKETIVVIIDVFDLRRDPEFFKK